LKSISFSAGHKNRGRADMSEYGVVCNSKNGAARPRCVLFRGIIGHCCVGMLASQTRTESTPGDETSHNLWL